MSELAVTTLQTVSTSTDAFPPLRSAADGALWVATNVKVCPRCFQQESRKWVSSTAQTSKHAKAEWAAFANYVQQGVACALLVASKDAAPMSPALEAHLRILETFVKHSPKKPLIITFYLNFTPVSVVVLLLLLLLMGFYCFPIFNWHQLHII